MWEPNNPAAAPATLGRGSMTALYVHTAILWAAFFTMMAAPPRSLLLKRSKQLAGLTFAVLVVESFRVYGLQ